MIATLWGIRWPWAGLGSTSVVTRLAIWASTLCAMSAHQVRAFAEGDTDACFALMRENTPEFFTSSELAAFEGWLGSDTSPYLVIEDADGRILACGGYSVDVAERLAGLTWGMVARARHRQGIGSLLLRERLHRIAGDETAPWRWLLHTSQHSRGFFLSAMGLGSSASRPTGMGPGSTAATCG